MERKQRLFIYDRKEMGVLILLGVTVALFAFTLGVHLGKRVGPKSPGVVLSADGTPVETVPDKAPERTEFPETKPDEPLPKADESLHLALHDEVARTGIKLDEPKPLELPNKAKSKNAGATSLTTPTEKSEVKSEDPREADQKSAAEVPHASTEPEGAAPPTEATENEVVPTTVGHGRYTLQVGSYPNMGAAKEQLNTLESEGMKPFIRKADLKSRGQWFRLFVGEFDTKDAAERAGRAYRDKNLINSFIVAKRVE